MKIEQFTIEHDGKTIVCTFNGALLDMVEKGTTDTIAFAIYNVPGAVDVSYCVNGYHDQSQDVTAHYLNRMPIDMAAREILKKLPLHQKANGF